MAAALRPPEGRMIKLVYCITRRPDLSHAKFSRYWRDVHAPIGAKIPGLRKLVQSHTIRTDVGGMDYRPPTTTA